MDDYACNRCDSYERDSPEEALSIAIIAKIAVIEKNQELRGS
jgi:hypothetical protein